MATSYHSIENSGISPPLDHLLYPEESVIPLQSRFGIGEWYGNSFTELSPETMLEYARYKLQNSNCLKSADRARLITLRNKSLSANLNSRDQNRKDELERRFLIEQSSTKLCPFKELPGYGNIPCTKAGGVCSLRAYEQGEAGTGIPVSGDRGAIRTLCPSRFHEGAIAFKWASQTILNQPDPLLVGEVGFLESSDTYDGSEGEDVGRIDMVVVDATKPANHPLPWLALEIQAVYFSGPEMRKLFSQIERNIESGGTGIVYPKEVRRPDYRSSGPKRLMPQLQIKIPTLRRWGKRMAIVVDRPFYESMGNMQTVAHESLSDVIWFVVDFKKDQSATRFTLKKGSAYFMTLEEAVKGLTGGTPVAQPIFEGKIMAAIKTNHLAEANPKPSAVSIETQQAF